MDELLVECVYSEDGCKYQGQRQLLAAHLKDECAFSDAGKMRSAAESKGKCVEDGEQDQGEKVSESRTETLDTTQRVRLSPHLLHKCARSHPFVVKIAPFRVSFSFLINISFTNGKTIKLFTSNISFDRAEHSAPASS